MIRSLVIAAALIAASDACAQQQHIPTAADRLATQIGQLAIENANLSAQNEQLQQALAAAQARIKQFEPKPEGERQHD
jgi:hypothetical protein